jgi:hypothetical protein
LRDDEAKERAEQRNLSAAANTNMFRLGLLSSIVAIVIALANGGVTVFTHDKSDQSNESKKPAYFLQMSSTGTVYRFDPITGSTSICQPLGSGAGFAWFPVKEPATVEVAKEGSASPQTIPSTQSTK